MKTILKNAAFLVSLIAVAVSCGDSKEKPLPPGPDNPTVVEASINAPTKSFVINGSNIPVAFSIDAAKEVLTDAVFTVTTDGDIDHEVAVKTLTIPKGAKTIAGELMIKSSATKKGSVRISIASANKDIKVVNKEVVINLTEEGIVPPSGYCEITVGYNAYSSISAFSIGDKKEENISHSDKKGWTDRTGEVVMLSTGASQISLTYQQGTTTNGDPYALVAWIDLNGDGKFSAAERVLYEEFLADGPHSATAKLNVPTDAAKAGRIRFGTYFTAGKTTLKKDTGCGHIDSGDLIDMTYNLVEGELLPDLSVSATNTNITLDKTDISQELVVSLTKAIDKDLVVLLNMKGGFEGACELPESVTIPANQTSATTNIKFLAAGFPAEAVTAAITLSVAPGDEMLANVGNSGSIIFNVKGTGSAIIASIAFESASVKIGTSDGVAKYTITLSENATKNTTINVVLTGADATYIGSPLTSSITIPTGTKTGSGEVQLLASGFVYEAIVKNIVATISSGDVVVVPSANSAKVAVNGSTTGLTKPTLNIDVVSSSAPMFLADDVTSSFKVFIPKAGSKVVVAPEDLVFKIRVNGATEGVHYRMTQKQFTLKKGESSFNPITIEWIKAGFKEGESRRVDLFVDVVSGYALASDYSAYFTVIRPKPGVYCPVEVDSPTANQWGALRGYSVGTLTSTTLATKSYQDLTSTPTTIQKGANTFTVTVGTDAAHPKDNYSVAMYIDWNGDGNFAGVGENYSTPLFMIGEQGNSQVKTFTVTPPADAKASSRIRFGLLLKGMMENGCVTDFESHKIVDMTYQLAK